MTTFVMRVSRILPIPTNFFVANLGCLNIFSRLYICNCLCLGLLISRLDFQSVCINNTDLSCFAAVARLPEEVIPESPDLFYGDFVTFHKTYEKRGLLRNVPKKI